MYNMYLNGYKSMLVEPLQKSLYFDFLVIGELFYTDTRIDYHPYQHQCYRETGHSHLLWLIIILRTYFLVFYKKFYELLLEYIRVDCSYIL